MAPHCDSMDGPVVMAARKALDSQDVNVVLPCVKKDGEEEVTRVRGGGKGPAVWGRRAGSG